MYGLLNGLYHCEKEPGWRLNCALAYYPKQICIIELYTITDRVQDLCSAMQNYEYFDSGDIFALYLCDHKWLHQASLKLWLQDQKPLLLLLKRLQTLYFMETWKE